jgi:iron complex outermembrane recepter protein
MRQQLAVLLCLACLAVPSTLYAQATVSGVVRDAGGGVISNATVVVRMADGSERQTVTAPDGRFTFERVPAGQATVVVRAGGFAERTQSVAAPGQVEIQLELAALQDRVTVTPTRTEQRLGEVPASVSVLDRDTIRRSAGAVADDVLRQVPTFSLFRRTSSLAAHPTAQGVSLRGIGPSGVSRALVLLDGVPFNDPFGGWVYWTRVPLDNVERVEIVDGTSSSLYGNYAMGGVINVVSARPQPRTFEFQTRMGNRGSRKADFFASDVWNRVGVSVEGSVFGTDGFPIVAAAERGTVDTQAAVDYHNFNVKLDYQPTDRVSTFVRGGYFREERDNAKFSTFDLTPEANDTLWKSLSGGIRATLPDQSDLQGRLFFDFERFNSNFLAVPNLQTRAIGRMSLLQRVPTTGVGGSLQWTKPVTARTLFTAGTDLRRVNGATYESGLDTATGQTVILQREAGGTQQSTGVFAQGQFWPVPRLSLSLSGRVDHWRNYDARHNETTVATGLPALGHRGPLADREDTVFSPRAGALYRINDHVRVWGSIGSGFRAPTLNELYRQFQVGQTRTLANENLGPERLWGGELGVGLAPVPALTVRSTWFDNRVRDAVSNVSLSDVPLPPAVTTLQQRQNLGRTRIWGLQTDAEYRLREEWRLSGAYLFNQAKVREFDANPALVGNYLPQVPKHRGSASVAYANPRIVSVAVTGLFFGRQFDDDLNQRVRPGETEPGLPGYAVLEVTAARELNRNVEVFFAAQNLFDTEYYVGLLPTTIGSPRLVTGGLRVRFAAR